MSSATKERAQTTLASWWSVQQVCMWIATRNERLVQYVGAKDSMLQVSETMSLAPHVNDSGEAATIPEILKSLKVACEFGQISFFGKENAEGTHVQVPADLWPMLEMRESDERGRRPIAAPTKDNGNGGKWWDDLFARAEEAIRQWPVPRKRRSFGFIVGDNRPDSIGGHCHVVREVAAPVAAR